MKTRKPVHPGIVFLEDVLKPLDISITDAAKKLGVTRKALSEFVNERTSLSADMALRIGKATKTTPESWMNMQTKLTLYIAQQNSMFDVQEFKIA